MPYSEMQESVKSMLEWMKDMKQVDAIAEWGWEMFLGLYPGLHPDEMFD
jgi:hypothetical protein